MITPQRLHEGVARAQPARHSMFLLGWDKRPFEGAHRRVEELAEFVGGHELPAPHGSGGPESVSGHPVIIKGRLSPSWRSIPRRVTSAGHPSHGYPPDMATGKERGARHAEFLALAGQIERLRVTDPKDLPDTQRAEALQRWQHVFGREIDEAIERRDRSVGKLTAADTPGVKYPSAIASR